MDEYTPTDMEVEVRFITGAGHNSHPGSRKEQYDRWLAAHDAQVRAAAISEALSSEAYPLELLEFRSAWEAADMAGRVGYRVRDGLAAVFATRAKRLGQQS
ncbi:MULTISPECIES: hypothetical protein [unclassified Microbacterium]|uniref:hypothetical protein n=1 Tax=unclassified Microbacterium TaxID=2609290 RepID=UPI000EA9CF64|nr:MULTISPECIES: hypothetical protein [unclassified Microbacterium]MBT2485781.1 hypothetical protein [Microbacterium sp. ISL-108]RKN68543.1 hypothetical protein D7252_13770 [Microbacterium sp. CGR2]